MPLKKLIFKPGVNRENTRYTTEGGYYETEKVRFRQGTPEMIGGWVRHSLHTFDGVCRSLHPWVALNGTTLIGVGTNKKFYVSRGGAYYNITPIRATQSLSGPFTAVDGSTTLTVAASAHGCYTGDFVTFYGATGLGGNVTASVLNDTYEVTVTGSGTFTIELPVAANATDAAGSPGGGSVLAQYQVHTQQASSVPIVGWGAGTWSDGTWGVGTPSVITSIGLWTQNNYGEDLLIAVQEGAIYYWNASYGVTNTVTTMTIASPAVVTASITPYEGDMISFVTTGALPTGVTAGATYYVRNPTGSSFNLSSTPSGALINTSGVQSGTHYVSTRALPLTSFATASDVPVVQLITLVTDNSRFVFSFGCNDYGSVTLDPMLIRWSDQEDPGNWTPAITNQAGSIRLTSGSTIVAVIQARNELLVWTDTALYSLQYVGPPYVWSLQNLSAESISCMSMGAAVLASGAVYWMGTDKFYKYDGRVQTLRCDLRKYVYTDINLQESAQFFGALNEAFNEVWWFYCSSGASSIDRYVVYNYLEDIWYYGTLARTAWVDAGVLRAPFAASYTGYLLEHETGLNNGDADPALPIEAYVVSSEFDIDDGHHFGFVWRILPDITFKGSDAASPTATMTLYPLQNAGSGYTNPASVGGSSYADVSRTSEVPIEQFTGQIYVRVRGRQMAFKVSSNQLDTTWQLGAPRIDIRPDGRR